MRFYWEPPRTHPLRPCGSHPKSRNEGHKKIGDTAQICTYQLGRRANEKILKTVYEGTVRPHLEYASSAWSTTAKTNQQVLDKVQNQALRLITGAMRSTPIKTMEQLTAIQPLSKRRETKTLVQTEKYRSIMNYPMEHRLENLAGSRLKRHSFVRSSEQNTGTITPPGLAKENSPTESCIPPYALGSRSPW